VSLYCRRQEEVITIPDTQKVYFIDVYNEDMDRVPGYEDKTVPTMREVLNLIASKEFAGQFGVIDLETVALFDRAGREAIYIDEELSLKFPHTTDKYTGYTLKVEGPA
jgi:hypothetical protein